MDERPLEGRRQRKKRQLRAHIYEAARQLFLKHGYEATTVAQIADAADVAPATFFNHFASKGAVLAEMTSEVSDHLHALVDRQLERSASTQERVRGFADSVATDIAEARGLARDVLLELMRGRSRPGEDAPYLSPVHEPFAVIIREGQQAGQVRVDLDATFLGEMALGALNVAISHWMNDPEFPLEQWLRQGAAFICEAIEPRPSQTDPPGEDRSV
ncbi:MAG: TetR/AcrR family transcriptional regulator [Myxococcota bacterium]